MYLKKIALLGLVGVITNNNLLSMQHENIGQDLFGDVGNGVCVRHRFDKLTISSEAPKAPGSPAKPKTLSSYELKEGSEHRPEHRPEHRHVCEIELLAQPKITLKYILNETKAQLYFCLFLGLHQTINPKSWGTSPLHISAKKKPSPELYAPLAELENLGNITIGESIYICFGHPRTYDIHVDDTYVYRSVATALIEVWFILELLSKQLGFPHEYTRQETEILTSTQTGYSLARDFSKTDITLDIIKNLIQINKKLLLKLFSGTSSNTCFSSCETLVKSGQVMVRAYCAHEFPKLSQDLLDYIFRSFTSHIHLHKKCDFCLYDFGVHIVTSAGLPHACIASLPTHSQTHDL